ncbi:MAG: hypothetical protein JWO06_2901 [Bacteroidota bacterium]|nr:hypothetical protein [Bacteroidota bacterium]
MRKKILFILLVFVLSATLVNSQGRTWNVWCFGSNAELDFNSGSPVAVSGDAIVTQEGCASICDSTTGQLLFYTDGSIVWDKNNQRMPNNTILLGGNSSSTQSAIIVPKPGSTTLYYIFTVGAQAGYAGVDSGMSVSVIDMSLRGGLGDVSQQPQQLIVPTCEKVSACRMAGSTGYWVITHLYYNDEFYAIPITPAGLGTPVISHQGLPLPNLSQNGEEAIGYMKVSPDGTKIAMAAWILINRVDLYNFDNSTGLVSPPIFTDSIPVISNGAGPYGLSFSPNGQLLYVGIVNDSHIYQYNLNAGNGAAIIASKYPLLCSNGDAGALQLGPDGKLYVVNGFANTLDCINSPNVYGAGCNYVSNAVSLGTGNNQLGLPNFIDALFYPDTTAALPLQASVNSSNSTCGSVCTGTANASAQFGTPPYTYNWQPVNKTTAAIDSLCAGTYKVTVTDNNGASVTDSVVVSSPAPAAVTISCPETTFCSSDSTQICATSGFTSYHWNMSQTTQCIEVRLGGNYYVTATDNNNCTAESNHLSITVYPQPSVSISINGDTLTLYNANNYQWYRNDTLIPGANHAVYIAKTTGYYSVQITDSNGCVTTSNPVLVTVTGITSLTDDDLGIFPNPLITGNWQLTVDSKYLGAELAIFDAEGRIVYRSVINDLKSEIPLNAARGIYLLHVYNAQYRAIKKLVKE